METGSSQLVLIKWAIGIRYRFVYLILISRPCLHSVLSFPSYVFTLVDICNSINQWFEKIQFVTQLIANLVTQRVLFRWKEIEIKSRTVSSLMFPVYHLRIVPYPA